MTILCSDFLFSVQPKDQNIHVNSEEIQQNSDNIMFLNERSTVPVSLKKSASWIFFLICFDLCVLQDYNNWNILTEGWLIQYLVKWLIFWNFVATSLKIRTICNFSFSNNVVVEKNQQEEKRTWWAMLCITRTERAYCIKPWSL
jgi:hypothetical protein